VAAKLVRLRSKSAVITVNGLEFIAVFLSIWRLL